MAEYQWRIKLDLPDGGVHDMGWIDVEDGDFQNLSCVGRLEFRKKPTREDGDMTDRSYDIGYKLRTDITARLIEAAMTPVVWDSLSKATQADIRDRFDVVAAEIIGESGLMNEVRALCLSAYASGRIDGQVSLTTVTSGDFEGWWKGGK